MAISCEKVYSGTGDQIYPETADKAVTVLAKNTTLDIYLAELAELISKAQGADQVAKSLKFKIDYLALRIRSNAKSSSPKSWSKAISFGKP